MSRAIVLIVCLTAAGVVAGYTHYSKEAADQPPVFTVHAPRPSVPASAPITTGSIQKELPVPEDRVSLVRALQRELKRVGCYSGEVSGVWTTSSRMAMKSFVDNVNASLPVDNPDQVLLSLVRGHSEKACATPGTAVAKASASIAPAETDVAAPPVEKQSTGPSTVAPAIAAAAALAATAAVPKGEPGISPAEPRNRAAAAAPDTGNAASDRPERAARPGGPAPSGRVYERRRRGYSDDSRPPKFVRDFFRTFGIR